MPNISNRNKTTKMPASSNHISPRSSKKWQTHPKKTNSRLKCCCSSVRNVYLSIVIKKIKNSDLRVNKQLQQGLRLVWIEAYLKKYTSINANIVTKIQCDAMSYWCLVAPKYEVQYCSVLYIRYLVPYSFTLSDSTLYWPYQ